MKKILNLFLALLLIIASVGFINVAEADAAVVQPKLDVESACIVEVESNKILFSKNMDTKFYPSSLIKMVSAIVALDHADLTNELLPKEDELVIIGKEIGTLPEGYKSMGLIPGDVVSLPELIRAMLILDADDAAISIAVYIGRKDLGGYPDNKYGYDKDALDNYIEMLNHEANILGLKNTYFFNATGISYGTSSFSTAEDMARIADAFSQKKFLCSVVKENSFNGVLSNNPFLDPDSEYYDKRVSGIISYSSNKGTYIAIKAEYHDINIVICVIDYKTERVPDADGNPMIVPVEHDYSDGYENVRSLVNYVFDNYVKYRYIEEGQQITQYYVDGAMDASEQALIVCAGQSSEYLVRTDNIDNFGYVVRLNNAYLKPTVEDLYDKYIQPEGTISKGTIIGTLDIYYNTVYQDSVFVYAGNTVRAYKKLPEAKKVSLKEKLPWSQILVFVLLAVILVFCIIQVVSIVNNLKIRKNKKAFYAAERAENKAAMHYSKKKK